MIFMRSDIVKVEELELSEKQKVREVNGYNIYLRGYNYDLRSDTKLYRYIKLSSLLDMLFYDKMHVSNRQDFSDLQEKNGLNKIAEGIPSIYSFSVIPSYHERIRKGRQKRKTLSVCVSCWTFDCRNNGKTDESFLMWKAYSNNEITCRIGTTIDRLINSIKQTPSDIVISDVDYQGQKEMNEYEDMIFRKSLFYEDEQEVRMAVLSSNREGIDLEVDNSILLNEIKLSPFVPPTLTSFILGQLQNWCKSNNCTRVNVERSQVKEYIETNKKYKRGKELNL